MTFDPFFAIYGVVWYLVLGAGAATMVSRSYSDKIRNHRKTILITTFLLWPLAFVLCVVLFALYPFVVMRDLLNEEK